MAKPGFNKCVFINCPFDEAFEPLLSAIVFCTVRFGLKPRLANERLETGLDYGLRHSGDKKFARKRFLVFESSRYDLKAALSDTAGHDVLAHENTHGKVFNHMRNFFSTETKTKIPGASLLQNEYSTCLGWVIERMIALGHSEEEAKQLPTKEIISAMEEWIKLGKPAAHAMPAESN